jgi:hypothetical protein
VNENSYEVIVVCLKLRDFLGENQFAIPQCVDIFLEFLLDEFDFMLVEIDLLAAVIEELVVLFESDNLMLHLL